MKQAAAYIRVSTDEQLEFSPDSQLKLLREYAEKHDMLLADECIFSDEGISGRSAEKRPAFMRMIAAAKQKMPPFSVVLVWKYSRFARSRQDSIFYKTMLRRECGVEVISITEQLTDDPTSILIEALLEAMDEYYSINLAQEVRRGMSERFSRGVPISAAPFGYRMEQGRLLQETEEAKIVRYIYRSFLCGETIRMITESLNTMGILTKRGHPFECRSVKYILSNPIYAGFLRRSASKKLTGRYYQRDGAEIVSGQHKGIVSTEDFNQVQLRLTKRGREEKLPVNREGFMLRGLIRCSACGALLTRSGGKNGLQCSRYSRGQCAQSHYVSLVALDAAVLQQMRRDLSGCVLCVVPEEKRRNDENESLFRRAQRSMQRIEAAYVAGTDSLEEYTGKKIQLQQILKKLTEENSIQAEEQIPLEKLLELLGTETINTNIKNAILHIMLDKIVFHCPQREIEIYYRA